MRNRKKSEEHALYLTRLLVSTVAFYHLRVPCQPGFAPVGAP